MGKKRVLVSYGVDIDAVAGWLGSYGGEDSTSDISRGLFAGTVGVQRLLKLFDKYNIKATWFIPGHTLETFPEDCAAIRDKDHEIGLHGYSHENPADMTIDQQRDVLDKTYKMLTEFCGKPPKGSVAPWWETSREGAELLLSYGIEYDHSMSHEDCQMYWLRDSWTKIDYSKKAEEWMKPLVKGEDTGIVEIPANWYIDDLPPMMFIKKAANSHGWVSARDVEQLWMDHFDYFYREHDEFVFPMTIHPDVSGRPHVLLMHERIIEHINKHEGVEWVTMGEMSDDFKKKNSPPPNALMPATREEVDAMLKKQQKCAMEEREVDFRALEYVSTYDDNLSCPICRSAFVDPVVVSDCDHHFCRDCLDYTSSWNQRSGNCPICRRAGRLNGSGSASKLLANILDELVVKCPKEAEGCDKQIKRGHLVDHINIYCQYTLVDCPQSGCEQKVRRKDAAQCVHQPVSCLACRQNMTVQDLDSHWQNDCADHDVPCPSCAASIPYRYQQTHLALHCPETNAACPARQFGCPFNTKRKHLPSHALMCSLAKLAPYLSAQQQRQDEQDQARLLLEKKLAILQQELDHYKIQPQQEKRVAAPCEDTSYFANNLADFELSDFEEFQPHASPTQHLLSLHENLREEVSRQANTIHEIDTRLSMMLLNENMRLKDELAYQGAQLSALMRQVGWLTNARLQSVQPNLVSPAGPADQGPSDSSRINPRLPVRRTTDEGRTKL
ncbi:polysaccharide deacetylase [Aureobasidium subglaciale]|nr:polysaccharide deacetylase [Aureobasidium subglaciale]